MGWHRIRHKISGSEMKMLAKSAEICHIPGMGKRGARDLANRWFQPLTHVSGGSFPRFPATLRQRGKRETRREQRFARAQTTAHSVSGAFA